MNMQLCVTNITCIIEWIFWLTERKSMLLLLQHFVNSFDFQENM